LQCAFHNNLGHRDPLQKKAVHTSEYACTKYSLGLTEYLKHFFYKRVTAEESIQEIKTNKIFNFFYSVKNDVAQLI
jgi:hypothetical protein